MSGTHTHMCCFHIFIVGRHDSQQMRQQKAAVELSVLTICAIIFTLKLTRINWRARYCFRLYAEHDQTKRRDCWVGAGCVLSKTFQPPNGHSDHENYSINLAHGQFRTKSRSVPSLGSVLINFVLCSYNTHTLSHTFLEYLTDTQDPAPSPERPTDSTGRSHPL